MLVTHPNITQKNYRKFNICLRPDGFSYCVTDTLSGKVVSMDDVRMDQGNATDDSYLRAFSTHSEFSEKYDEVEVTHQNGYNTFVPQALFDENFLGSYLQYNTRVFESDRFAFDELSTFEMNNVYMPFSSVNDFLEERFASVHFKHSGSVLVSRLLEASKNNDDKQVFVYFAEGRFDLVVVHNQKLLLYNSFEYRTKEDFIYYLLFAAEQLSLNPEHFKLQLLGNVTQESDCFKIAYKFVRQVSLLDVSKLASRNDFGEAATRKHFILLQS